MPTTYNKNSLSTTYKDDWEEGKGFHKILFNSGKALQARELTQLQTIIQKEIERLGQNVFKGGAAVNAGSTQIDSKVRYVKVSSFTASDPSLSFSDIPVGLELTGTTTGVEAKVVESISAVNSDPNTIYVQYTSQGTQTSGATTTEFSPTENLVGGGWSFTASEVGSGTKFTADEGDYFALGHFVHASKQSIFLSKYSNSGVNASVGYKVNQDIVSVSDDSSLYDNSGDTPNTSAPGADRYRITLTLVNEADVAADETFIKIASVENNIIVDTVTSFEDYNEINNVLATRTYEESGNYIVEPFFIHMEENSDVNKLDLIVSSGTAYVKGHRAYKPSSTRLVIPKPVKTETVTNNSINVNYGNYFMASSAAGLPDLFSDVNLYNSSNVNIGSAKIKSVEKDGAQLRVYLFDIAMSSGEFRDVASVGDGSLNSLVAVTTTEQGLKLQDAVNNNLLFDLPRPRPGTLTSISIETQRAFSIPPTGPTGQATISVSGSESFTNTSSWIIAYDNNAIESGTIVLSSSDQIATISGLTPNISGYKVYAIVNNSSGAVATKNLVETAGQQYTLTTSGGMQYIDLGQYDVHSITQITSVDVNGEDLSGMFIFDNGQRDNYYQHGRLILKSTDTPSTSIFVKFKYFQRTSSGNFYSAQSYGGIDYKDIPSYTQKDGTKVSLRNVLDFRPDKAPNGTLSNTKELPLNATNLTADVQYYLPRADKVIIDQNGEVSVLMGEQDEHPKFKTTPENALTLYKVILNANTFGPDDIKVTPVEHRRYTMADIRDLEDKIDKLEESTSLSFLELESKLSQLFDSDGNLRLESGFVVDNFSDQIGSNTTSPEYLAAIDPESRTLRPGFDEDNVRLIIDQSASTNVSVRGDNVYISYDSASWKFNTLASKSIPVNPFNSHPYVGEITLSPSSDDWKVTGTPSNYAVNGANTFDNNEALLWNGWQWNWSGRSAEDIHQPPERFVPRNRQFGAFGRTSLIEMDQYYSDQSTSQNRTSSSGHVNRVFFSETIRSRYGNRYVDCALIPWIRSKKIFFKVSGLKPNTTFIPYFDGKRFDDWCREEASFVRVSDTTDDLGNTYASISITSHPDGSTPLVSDEKGEIIGSFFIPSSTDNRFRAGRKEFKLLDITENDYNAAGSKAVAFYNTAGLFDNNQQNITSTREPEPVSPISNNLSFPLSYRGRDITSYLDGIGAADVLLYEPHLVGNSQQQVAGVTAASYTGDMSVILSDYVNTDENQLSSSSSEAVSVVDNPMAQSFYVDNQFGVVLTKINLFFSAKDDHLPVSLKLRPMINGAPSTQVSVPGSAVTLNSSDVNVVAETSTTLLSEVQTAPTTFTFEEPIYLAPWTEYALVLSSPSSDYKVYVGDAREYVLGSTSKLVTAQEATSNFFMPQVGTTWAPSSTMNLMFETKRASFKSNGSLLLKNVNLPGKLLEENPIKTTANSSIVFVKHRCHGLDVGEQAIISGLTATDTYADILGSAINGTHTITAADINGYSFDVGSNATVTSSIGGGDVIAGRNIQYNVLNPQIQQIIPNSTSTVISSKTTSGKSISGSETKYVRDAHYSRIALSENVTFPNPRIIANLTNETTSLSGNSSVSIKVDLKSGNDYVSPIVDLQRCSMILVGNCIDDNSTISPVAETHPRDGTAGAKHVTTVYDLVNDAVGMQILFNYNVPSEADLDVYYRTATDGVDIEDEDWVYQDTESALVKTEDASVYSEAQALPGGIAGSLAAFNKAQVKIVMRSTNTSAVPTVKDLRIKFLTT